jgi:hypothetical protein
MSGACETAYARSSVDCDFNGDGTGYGCAASGGAAGAWRGLANVVKTVTTGVDDCDTLKICGSFPAGDMMVVNSTGIFLSSTQLTAASESARITVTGDCSAEGNTTQCVRKNGSKVACAILDGGGTTTNGLAYSVANYLTVRNIKFTNFTGGFVANTCAPTTDPISPKFINLFGDGAGGTLMAVEGLGYLIDGVEMSGQGEGLFVCKGNGSSVSGTITNNKFTTLSTVDANADGIQIEDGGSGVYMDNNEIWKSNPFKGCFIAGSSLGPVQINRPTCHIVGPTAQAAAVSGVAVDGSTNGGYVRNGFFDGGGNSGDAILLRASTNVFVGDFTVSGNIIANFGEIVSFGGQASPAGTIVVEHNSGWASQAGLFAASGFNPSLVTVRDNAFSAPTALDINATVAAADFDLNNNNYANITNWKWRGTTDTTFGAYKTTSSKDAASLNVSHNWLGGNYPTAPLNFRLMVTSSLCKAAYSVPPFAGVYYDTARFAQAPDIGALRCKTN